MRYFAFAVMIVAVATARADEKKDKEFLNGFSWGVSVAEIKDLAERGVFEDVKLPTKTGVCVVYTNPYGVASKGGVVPLTLIDVVNGKRVRTPDDFIKATESIKPGDRISMRAHLPMDAGRSLKWSGKTIKGVARPRLEGLKEQAKAEEDVASGATHYRHKDTSEFVNSKSEVYIDIVSSGATVVPRLGIRYVADDWLFIEDAKLVIGEKAYAVPLNGKRFERDNKSTIWEWIVLAPESTDESDPLMKIMQEMSRNGPVQLVLNGQQYRKDRKLEDAELGRITQMWWYFLALRSGAF